MSQLKTSEKIQNLIDWLSSSSSSNFSEKERNNCDKKFYITTAINYTNGKPHIGHAYEAIVSDIISRYHRIYGRDVFFLTGTDEHGQKVATTAEGLNLTPKQLCDQNVVHFQELNKKLRISNDRFIRTTDKNHYKLAQHMFSQAFKNGDIYKSKYVGWYNLREEQYITETEAKLSNYLDPVSGKNLQKHEEEAYFFRMSKYQDRLIEYMKNHKDFIQPANAYNHILKRLETPLEDLCSSRSTFNWGVPVPNDNNHVMYVWFDALTNYLSGVDYFEPNSKLSHYWPANVHIIGRDIVWFHTVIWPCILMSCNVPLPKTVFCHGFVTDANGSKMSKSLGNVIDPIDMLAKYDADSIRYFVASQASFGDDMKWSIKDLQERHDAHLTHIFGNFVNRSLVLTQKSCQSQIPDSIPDVIFDLNKLRNECEQLFKEYKLLEASIAVMDRLRACNDWLTKIEPWKIKNDDKKRNCVLRTALEAIYVLAHFMEPFTPRASKQVFDDLDTAPIHICDLKDNFQHLKAGTKINVGELLFNQFTSKHEKKIANANRPEIARCQFIVGKIIEIKKHPEADKCYVEKIDCGEAQPRIIVSGLVPYCKEEDLLNHMVIVFANLKPAKMKNINSNGMVLAASNDDHTKVHPLIPPANTKPGDRLQWDNIDLSQWEVDPPIDIRKKNSFWISDISPTLKTNQNGEMTWNGKAFTVANQTIKAPFNNAQIS